MPYKKSITKEQGLQKLKHYCSHQERSHAEVRDKLFKLGIWSKDHDEIITPLIEENYLNEERFAILYAGGHFRTKDWGRIKIKYQLKKKLVSEYCIKKALASIEAADYMKTLARLAEQKLKLLKSEKNQFIRKKKLQDYLLQKGFETDLVKEIGSRKL